MRVCMVCHISQNCIGVEKKRRKKNDSGILSRCSHAETIPERYLLQLKQGFWGCFSPIPYDDKPKQRKVLWWAWFEASECRIMLCGCWQSQIRCRISAKWAKKEFPSCVRCRHCRLCRIRVCSWSMLLQLRQVLSLKTAICGKCKSLWVQTLMRVSWNGIEKTCECVEWEFFQATATHKLVSCRPHARVTVSLTKNDLSEKLSFYSVPCRFCPLSVCRCSWMCRQR